ncbi:unnamed protein product [marine sediment metagenome]|uniref:Uncharacterized protein n=1 Tax=marine sediment metagenome TaxID=412755 RepID=X1SS50_9ZZZZ
MAIETQAQGLGQFIRWGFTLKYPNDHVVELRHQGELVARFSQTGATEESIQAECALHLAKRHGWDGTLWERR